MNVGAFPMKKPIEVLSAHGATHLGAAPHSASRRIVHCRKGIAATEFALILPILMVIFFGMLEASDAMMTNRRVVNATNALVDLVGQERQVSPSDLDEIFNGVTNMLMPTENSPLSMRLVSVSVDPDDASRIMVEWSRDNQGNSPYANGATYNGIVDTTLLQAGVSLVVAELTYEHKSGLTDYVMGSPIKFNRTSTRWPRRSTKVRLCTGPVSNPTCV